MRKSLIKITTLTAGLSAPFITFGQTIEGVIGRINGLVQAVIPVLLGVAMVVFIWGIIKFITAAGDEEKRKSAVHILTYGVIGLFVLVSIWGIVAILSNFLFGAPPPATGFPVPNLNLPPITSPPSGATEPTR